MQAEARECPPIRQLQSGVSGRFWEILGAEVKGRLWSNSVIRRRQLSTQRGRWQVIAMPAVTRCQLRTLRRARGGVRVARAAYAPDFGGSSGSWPVSDRKLQSPDVTHPVDNRQ
jgi:hypothetical protein